MKLAICLLGYPPQLLEGKTYTITDRYQCPCGMHSTVLVRPEEAQPKWPGLAFCLYCSIVVPPGAWWSEKRFRYLNDPDANLADTGTEDRKVYPPEVLA